MIIASVTMVSDAGPVLHEPPLMFVDAYKLATDLKHSIAVQAAEQ